jgi:drug/metabolite transporter (DMT)-like permease
VGGVLVAFGSLFFGAVVVFGAFGIRAGLPVPSMLAFRYAVATTLLAAIVVAIHRPLVPESGERLGAVVLGSAGYALESALFFSALERGTAAAATLLFFTYPVFTTAYWVVLRRRSPTALVLGALALSVAGAGIVVGTSGGIAITFAGVAFALGAAAVYAMYLTGADAVFVRTSPLTAALWTGGWASLGLFAYALLLGGLVVPSGWSQWWPVVFMGAFTTGAFICLLAGIQRLGAVRTAIIGATEPLSSAVLAWIFLDQVVTAGIAVGGAAIVAGAVAATLARARPVPVEPPSP